MADIWFVTSNIKGLMCMPITLFIIFIISFTTIRFVIYPVYNFTAIGIAMSAIMLYFVVMVLWSWLKAMLTEPGKVMSDRELTEEERDFYSAGNCFDYCKVCHKLKPYRAHHCSKCKVCILKMDHHCIWINNCVGARNQKYFLLFLLYILLGAGYAFVIGLHYLWSTRASFIFSYDLLYLRHIHPINMYLPNWILDNVFVISIYGMSFQYLFLAVEVFFAMFIIIYIMLMVWDQYRAIEFDITYVEQLRLYKPTVSQTTFSDSFHDVMGEPFCLRWFFPVQGKYIDAIIKKLSIEFLTNEQDIDEYDESF